MRERDRERVSPGVQRATSCGCAALRACACALRGGWVERATQAHRGGEHSCLGFEPKFGKRGAQITAARKETPAARRLEKSMWRIRPALGRSVSRLGGRGKRRGYALLGEMALACLGSRADARAPHESRAPALSRRRAKKSRSHQGVGPAVHKGGRPKSARHAALRAPSSPQKTPEAVCVPHTLANLAVPLPVVSVAAIKQSPCRFS